MTAPKSSDGMSVLSTGDFPEDEWARFGLMIPAPLYSSGAYNGAACEPDARIEEATAYECKAASAGLGGGGAVFGAIGGGVGGSADTVEDAVTQAAAVRC